MNHRQTFATSLLASLILFAGCASDGAKPQAVTPVKGSPFGGLPSDSGWTTSTGGEAAARESVATPPATPAPVQPAVALPTIPADAKFTIFCEAYTGPNHVQVATEVRNILQRLSQLKDWYVIHQAEQSVLYHGYYTAFDVKAAGEDRTARRDAERAQRDHQLVESIPNPNAPRQKMFPRALFVSLDAPDPDSPPAWNLANAPGFWTVQIGAYTGPDRKRAAVESVRDARAANVPAYYYHGPNISSVCIGTWDRGAIKEGQVAVAGRREFELADGSSPGPIYDDPGAVDEHSDFALNVSGRPVQMRDARGNPIRTLQAKINVLDPTLLQALKDYPDHHVDGMVQMLDTIDKETGKPGRAPRPSLIVQIPRGPSPGVANSGSNQAEPDTSLINPDASRQDLGARLRGIGR